MTYDTRFTKFTAGDVERITGINLALQRDWRRRGYLPKSDAPKATFHPLEVANVLALAEFNALKIGPGDSATLAKSVGTAILWHAIQQEGAVLDPEGLHGREPIIHWPSGQQVRFVSTADGKSWTWAPDETAALAPGGRGRIVLDIQELGRHLAQSAGRPLVTVEPCDGRPS